MRPGSHPLDGSRCAIHISGTSYVDYLVLGFIATGVLMSAMGTAAATADDLEHGFIDRCARCRSLARPSSRLARSRYGTRRMEHHGDRVCDRIRAGDGRGPRSVSSEGTRTTCSALQALPRLRAARDGVAPQAALPISGRSSHEQGVAPVGVTEPPA